MPTISLPPRCDRAAAQALLPRMIDAQTANRYAATPLKIDARACVQIGQAMLQLLISARAGGDGAVIDPSPQLRETARRIGLTEELGLTENSGLAA